MSESLELSVIPDTFEFYRWILGEWRTMLFKLPIKHVEKEHCTQPGDKEKKVS